MSSVDEQSRIIGDVIQSVGGRSSALDKRLANLESAEYALLHFYGSMYKSVSSAIAIATAGVYYPVTGMVVGLLNGWTFADPALTCVKPGVYEVKYSISTTGMVNNQTQTAITQNNIALLATVNDILSTSAGGHQLLSGVGLFIASAGDTIRLVIANMTDVDDPTVDTASVVLKRIGD